MEALREPGQGLNECTRAVVDAAHEVYRTLGPGFPKAVYQDALGLELGWRGLAYQRDASIALSYKGAPVGMARLDFFVAGQLVVEVKAVDALLPVHMAQLLSQLRAAQEPLGLLINFNTPCFKDGVCRIINTY
jgi:GxxExxY protein